MVPSRTPIGTLLTPPWTTGVSQTCPYSKRHTPPSSSSRLELPRNTHCWFSTSSPRSSQAAGPHLDLDDLFKVGRTIQWSDLPERLWASTGLTLPNRKRFDDFGKLRNGLQHFAPAPGTDPGEETLRFVFEVVDPFINQCWAGYGYAAGQWLSACPRFCSRSVRSPTSCGPLAGSWEAVGGNLSELDYWLTTPRLHLVSGQSIQFGEALIRALGDLEANRIREALTKRLMGPARPTDVYAPKVEAFRNVTSLALRLPGSQVDHSTVREIGERYDALIFLTEAFALKRTQIHRLLGISSSQQHPSTDLILPVPERRWHYTHRFSTRTVKRPVAVQGLAITARTKRRFASLGLPELAPRIVRAARTETLKRVHEALRWLDQSLLEKDASAAVVKTCIGFESLFGFDKNEPLRQSISDRGAFLIARSAADRPAVAKRLRDFYDRRSAIVHGSSGKHSWTEEAQQQLDRLLLICALSLAALSG